MPKLNECARDIKKGEMKNFPITKDFLKMVKYDGDISVPNIEELSVDYKPTTSFIGGEIEGLRLMKLFCEDKQKVRNFEKPMTNPTDISATTTTKVSAYLKFGCLSILRFYHELNAILKGSKHTEPPTSLIGQIYWREFFYCGSVGVPNFHKMEGNYACKTVNWRQDKEAEEHLNAWIEGRTGYPWIDAIMNQLKLEGWIHHLARHCVACFLTRGDLYINWERGMEVFEDLLLDADYALNAGTWLWLSGTSKYFTSYFRIYSPVVFPKKYDPQGNYIRHFVPVLKNLPKEYIYEPWKAPKDIL